MLGDPVLLEQAKVDRDGFLVERGWPAVFNTVNSSKELFDKAVRGVFKITEPINQICIIISFLAIERQPCDLRIEKLLVFKPLFQRKNLDAWWLTGC
jgi:hypothetical protein